MFTKSGVIGLLVLVGATIALARPPHWAPAHGWRSHHALKHHERREVRKEHVVYRYRYYPECQVYYQPRTRQYFWLDNGAWQVGVRLPSGIRINSRHGISVELGGEEPYGWHEEIVRRYPVWR